MDHQSKYSKIITDTDHQSVNPNMEYHLTVEQYYDLTHHTHNVSELVNDGSSGDVSVDIGTLIETVNQLNTSVEELKVLINNNSTADEKDRTESDATVAEIREDISKLTQAISNNATNIESLIEAVNNNTKIVAAQNEAIDEMKIQINSLNNYVDQDIQYGETAES